MEPHLESAAGLCLRHREHRPARLWAGRLGHCGIGSSRAAARAAICAARGAAAENVVVRGAGACARRHRGVRRLCRRARSADTGVRRRHHDGAQCAAGHAGAGDRSAGADRHTGADARTRHGGGDLCRQPQGEEIPPAVVPVRRQDQGREPRDL